GGVRLELRSAEEVRQAFADILEAVRAARPEVTVEGVLVQRMAPAGVDAFVAARRDPLLGPMVVVGLGGLEVEALGDVSMRLAPVSEADARGMLEALRGSSLLRGTRGRAPADVEALVEVVVRVSRLATALPPGVVNVEINPLRVLSSGAGVLMLDAAIELEE